MAKNDEEMLGRFIAKELAKRASAQENLGSDDESHENALVNEAYGFNLGEWLDQNDNALGSYIFAASEYMPKTKTD